MFWAYKLKHFFKLNIKIDAGENIHKSGKNMIHDNKDRMIQILGPMYGTGIYLWVQFIQGKLLQVCFLSKKREDVCFH